jgi:hypothetical protein
VVSAPRSNRIGAQQRACLPLSSSPLRLCVLALRPSVPSAAAQCSCSVFSVRAHCCRETQGAQGTPEEREQRGRGEGQGTGEKRGGAAVAALCVGDPPPFPPARAPLVSCSVLLFPARFSAFLQFRRAVWRWGYGHGGGRSVTLTESAVLCIFPPLVSSRVSRPWRVRRCGCGDQSSGEFTRGLESERTGDREIWEQGGNVEKKMGWACEPGRG